MACCSDCAEGKKKCGSHSSTVPFTNFANVDTSMLSQYSSANGTDYLDVSSSHGGDMWTLLQAEISSATTFVDQRSPTSMWR